MITHRLIYVVHLIVHVADGFGRLPAARRWGTVERGQGGAASLLLLFCTRAQYDMTLIVYL